MTKMKGLKIKPNEDKTKTSLGMRRVLILALEGVRASCFGEKKKPFLGVLLVQVGRKEEEKKKGS